MSLLTEYVNKNWSIQDFEIELLKLIGGYNKLTGRYLFVFSTAMTKAIPDIGIGQADFYVFYDLLSNKNIDNIDIYIESPGGSGEATEEIVTFLRNKFKVINYVVAGDAKSAATIMVLSGDNIIMAKTGSLGPIDAQIRVGRSTVSAYDYMEWVDAKRKTAETTGSLNPFDAIMVAQITPGELGTVHNALEFAKDLVKKWLVKYKFKNWNTTETRKTVVSSEMKEKRASEIATELTNHTKWRSHGRSIKANDLENIGLKIEKIEGNPPLSDVVYRIKAVCTMLYDTSTIYKIYATEDTKLFRTAIAAQQNSGAVPLSSAQVTQIDIQCPKCGIIHKLYAKLKESRHIDDEMKGKGYLPFPENSQLVCKCGFEMDLSPYKNELEIKTGKKIIY